MNYYNKRDIIEEQRYLIGIEPVVDMKNFVLLLLADLARKTKIHDFQNPNLKVASLPLEYCDIIEKIMYEENGWGTKFASIIPIYYYYENQREWECKLGEAIETILIEESKTTTENDFELYSDFDLKYDCIYVYFTEDEINEIRSRCDSMLLEVMDHFSNLVSSYNFSRNAKIEDRESERMMNRLEYEIGKCSSNARAISKSSHESMLTKPKIMVKNCSTRLKNYLSSSIGKTKN